MAWRNLKVEEQRKLLSLAYLRKESTMTDLCKSYGISRKTGYKWYNKFLELGEEGLKDLSKAPQNPYRLYSEDLINLAVELKLKHRKWGPKKILIKLKKLYPKMCWPSATRLYEIFKELHLVTPRRIRRRVPATAPLGDLSGCNDTWTIDLKGWFLTADGRKCEPLTLMDSFSRFLIKCTHMDYHTVDHVWPLLDEAFREYGLPNRLRSDNGPPFGCSGAGRLTRLSVNLIKAGVTPEWIQPGHPEQNGRHERFHSTLQQSVANPPRQNLPLQIEAINQFHDLYNYERPHEALDMKTPAECYYRSSRSWHGVLRSPEYDTNKMLVRKICQSGCLWYKRKTHYIGQTVAGEYIGLKSNESGELEAYYGPVYLGKLDPDKGLEKPKIIKRRQR